MWSGTATCGNSTRPGRGNTGTGCCGPCSTGASTRNSRPRLRRVPECKAARSGERDVSARILRSGTRFSRVPRRSQRSNRANRRSLVFAHKLEHVVHVAIYFDLRPDLRDPAGAVDDHGGALDAHVLLAVQVLLLVHAVELRDRSVLVGEQRERQLVALAK